MFMNCCTDYFVASCETLITNLKPVSALIEAIGIGDLFSLLVIFILFHFASMAPKPVFVYPFLYPFLGGIQDTTGHCGHRGTQKTSVFIERLRFC